MRELQEIKRDLLSRMNIVDLASEYATHPMKRCGERMQTVCFLPNHVHGKYTPSLSLDPGTNTFHCFGNCGQKGNAIDLYMLMNRLDIAAGADFIEACMQLAARYGVDVGETEDESEKRAKKQRREEVLTAVAEQFPQTCAR